MYYNVAPYTFTGNVSEGGNDVLQCCNVHFSQGIFQKAEAMYYRGDFELALVFYHRGHKLRPELQEFRLGIQKAQEAIENSVGSESLEAVSSTCSLS